MACIAGWQRDLSVVLQNLGDMAQFSGDMAQAHANWQKSLEITEALAARDPTNVTWQIDLVICYQTVAKGLEYLGDSSQALAALKKSQKIAKALVAYDPNDNARLAALAEACHSLGRKEIDYGDLDSALVTLQDCVKLCEKQVERNPADAYWKTTLIHSYESTGVILRDQGNQSGAVELYLKGAQLVEAMVAQEQYNVANLISLCFFHAELARGLFSMPDESRAQLTKARRIVLLLESYDDLSQIHSKYKNTCKEQIDKLERLLDSK